MHPIVALPEEVECPRVPPLRYPDCIHCRPGEVDQGQRKKGREAHHRLKLGSKSEQAVYHWCEQACPEKAVHEELGRPVFRPAELGTERVHRTTKSRQGEQCEVDDTQGLVAVEGKVCPRHPCSPHDEHNAEVVELVSKPADGGAVVGESVVEGG